MNRRALTERDLREVPAYSIAEAAGYLESLFLCDLIDEVRVTVVRTDGTRIKFTQLSEGEQQLLTVLGLLLFTQNDESLYLLDEPDNCWDRIQEYLKDLEIYRADKTNVIAKHSFKQAAKHIRELMQDDKELSAVARACVLSTGDPRLASLLQSA